MFFVVHLVDSICIWLSYIASDKTDKFLQPNVTFYQVYCGTLYYGCPTYIYYSMLFDHFKEVHVSCGISGGICLYLILFQWMTKLINISIASECLVAKCLFFQVVHVSCGTSGGTCLSLILPVNIPESQQWRKYTLSQQ